MFRTHLVDGAGIFIRHRESGVRTTIIASQHEGEWGVSGTGRPTIPWGEWMTFQFEGEEIKIRFAKKGFMKKDALEVRLCAPKIIEISPLCRPFKKKVDTRAKKA